MPQSDLRRRKLTRLFSLYDRDGDGHVRRDDFERVAQGFARAGGVVPGSPGYRALEDGFLGFWQRLARMSDRDGDERVTLEEYLASHSETARASDAVVGLTDMMIALSDRDRDGKVSGSEYADTLLAFGMSVEDAATAFNQLDRDGDGYLTREELLRNVDEFYGSDDPEAAGNWLVGPF